MIIHNRIIAHSLVQPILARSRMWLVLSLFVLCFAWPYSPLLADDTLVSKDEFLQRLSVQAPSDNGMTTRTIGAKSQSGVPSAAKIDITVRFSSGSTELADSFSQRQLNELGAALASGGLSNYQFEIGGHTDSKGKDAYNLQLSKHRAQAVRDILCQEHKVDCGKLQAAGYGETQPIASNKTKSGRDKNRRISIKRL